MLLWKTSDCSKVKPTLSNWNQTITWIFQCVKILVQISFCQIDTSWSHLVRGNLNWEKYFPKTMDKTVGLALWLMIDVEGPVHCGRCYLWEDCLELPKKAAWKNHKELESHHGFSLQVPALTFLSEGWLPEQRRTKLVSSPTCFWLW